MDYAQLLLLSTEESFMILFEDLSLCIGGMITFFYRIFKYSLFRLCQCFQPSPT